VQAISEILPAVFERIRLAYELRRKSEPGGFEIILFQME